MFDLLAAVAARVPSSIELYIKPFSKKNERSEPHQADNLAKLRCGVLSLCEMIAQIIGAVEKQKPIVAFGIVQPRNSVATLTAFAPAR